MFFRSGKSSTCEAHGRGRQVSVAGKSRRGGIVEGRGVKEGGGREGWACECAMASASARTSELSEHEAMGTRAVLSDKEPTLAGAARPRRGRFDLTSVSSRTCHMPPTFLKAHGASSPSIRPNSLTKLTRGWRAKGCTGKGRGVGGWVQPCDRTESSQAREGLQEVTGSKCGVESGERGRNAKPRVQARYHGE
eukprot:scaffold1143_cov107-Isochrysis_galbana.AAC.9